jgi:hypothetical protein
MQPNPGLMKLLENGRLTDPLDHRSDGLRGRNHHHEQPQDLRYIQVIHNSWGNEAEESGEGGTLRRGRPSTPRPIISAPFPVYNP